MVEATSRPSVRPGRTASPEELARLREQLGPPPRARTIARRRAAKRKIREAQAIAAGALPERRITAQELFQKRLELRGIPTSLARRLTREAVPTPIREVRGIAVAPGAVTPISPGVERLIEQRRAEQQAALARLREGAIRAEDVSRLTPAQRTRRMLETEALRQRRVFLETGSQRARVLGEIAQVQAEAIAETGRLPAFAATGAVLAPLVAAAGPGAALALGVLGTIGAAAAIPRIQEVVRERELISPQARREFLIGRAGETLASILGFRIGAEAARPIARIETIRTAKEAARFKLKLKFEKELTRGVREGKSIREVFQALERKGKIAIGELELFAERPEISLLTQEQIRRAEEARFLTFKAKGKPRVPLTEKQLTKFKQIGEQLFKTPLDLDKVVAERQQAARIETIRKVVETLPQEQQAALIQAPPQQAASRIEDIASRLAQIRIEETLAAQPFRRAGFRPPPSPFAGIGRALGAGARPQLVLVEEILRPQVIPREQLVFPTLEQIQTFLTTRGIGTRVAGLLPFLGITQAQVPTQVIGQLPALTQIQQPLTAQIAIQRQRQIQRQILQQAQVQVPLQQQLLEQVQVPLQEQLLQQQLVQAQVQQAALVGIVEAPTVEEIERLRQPTPGALLTEQGFDVLVKRKLRKVGKKRIGRGFRKVNTQTLSRLAALGLGASIVDRFSNRSFRIKAVDQRPTQRRDLVNKWLQLRGKFRAAKRNKNTIVERTLFAIDTLQEKREIPFEAARLRRARRIQQTILGVQVAQSRRRVRTSQNQFLRTSRGGGFRNFI